MFLPSVVINLQLIPVALVFKYKIYRMLLLKSIASSLQFGKALIICQHLV